MADAGYDVSVICTTFIDWAIQHDKSYEGRRWRVVARVPFGPLAPKGLRIKQVIRQRVARASLAVGVASDALREAAWHPATPELTAAALRVKADLYIAHYPAALPAAAKAAACYGTRYAFDAEDFHLGDLPDLPEHEAERTWLRSIERKYLPGAQYVTAASPGIADAYARAYGITRPTVILNVFPLSHAPASASPRGVIEPRPSLYWFSQTIGPDRGLETAVAAIAQARSAPHLYVRGRPMPGYVERLRFASPSNEAAARIHVLPIAPAEEMERLAAAFDLGLVAETAHSQNRSICLTNKLFSFLLAGVPPMISATPGQLTFARNWHLDDLIYGLNDAAALARRLDELLENPGRLAAMRAHCYALGQKRFNWEKERELLIRCVRDVFVRQDESRKANDQ